jgi:hypothetical protein
MRKHDALPQQEGSLLREHDRAEVDGETPADYPLLARCKSERLSELPVRTPKACGHTPGEATFESGKAMRLALDDT